MASDDLVTTEEARRSPRLKTIDGTLLEDLISAASQALIGYCAREFHGEARTEYHTGDATGELLLNHIPVTAVASVTIVETDGTEVSVTVGGLDYDDVGRLWFLPSAEGTYTYFPKTMRKNVKIVYTAGWATADIPKDLKQACILLVGHMLGEAGRDTSKTGERLGDYSYTAAANSAGWPSLVTKIAGRYRDVKLPLDT